jgi:hypothetical protein
MPRFPQTSRFSCIRLHAGRLIRLAGVAFVMIVDVCGREVDEKVGWEQGPLFAEAQRQFATMTRTAYQHKTEVDQKAGTYSYDCVGFVAYAMKRVTPQARASAFKALEMAPGRIPSPPRYVAFFQSLVKTPQPGWQVVVRVKDLRPGDVVAWEYKTATSSGHAVIVGSVPVQGEEGSWVVKVYDSTSSPHGDDSRPRDARATVLPANGKPSGLGHGMMALAADPTTGVLTGYRWSPKAKTKIVPIAAARPKS